MFLAGEGLHIARARADLSDQIVGAPVGDWATVRHTDFGSNVDVMPEAKIGWRNVAVLLNKYL